MPSVYQLKPRFLALLRPVSRHLAQRGITANQITILACGLSLGYGALLALAANTVLGRYLWLGLPLWLFIRMALNAIDGQLAREFNQKSRLGGLLNEMGDVLADAALFAPLALVSGIWPWAVALFIWLALLTEYAGVCGLLIGGGRRYEGPMGKSDRATLIGGLGLWLGADWPIASPLPWLSLILLLATAAMGLTCYNRLRAALAVDPS
ncbi:MAG: CDP-alcohol phosphatidyltransferase family protein [Aeromonadaceae bacterium]